MIKKYLPWIAPAFVFTLIFLCLPAYFETSELLQQATLQTRDLFFKIRQVSNPPPESINRLVVVAIDDESCEKLQARWPWSRTIFAQLIRALRRDGVEVVGLNASFAGLENQNAESTDQMAQALGSGTRVIVGATFDENGRPVRPSQILTDAGARHGYLEKIMDADLEIRRSFLIRPYRFKDNLESDLPDTAVAFERSFPLEIVAAFLWPNAASSDGGGLRFDPFHSALVSLDGTWRFPLTPNGSYAINYLASEKQIPQISAWRLMQRRSASNDLRGRIALVGLTSSLFLDKHSTPLGMMPGVDVHANEILALLAQRPLKVTGRSTMFAVAWALGLTLLLLFLNHRVWIGLAAFLTALFGIFIATQHFLANDIVCEPFILFLGAALGALTGFVSDFSMMLFEKKGLETKVTRDKMTNLYNYEYLRMRLDEEWRRCQKGKTPVSVVMTDLDRFKNINDTLGHETGNQMILRAAAVIRQSVRGYDVVSRYGGDEFAILLWHSNDADAKAYRQRLRLMYHAMAAALEDPLLKDSSISIGIASFDPQADPRSPRNPQELIENADKDLFLDKESRRKPGQPGR